MISYKERGPRSHLCPNPGGVHVPPRWQAEENRDRSRAVATWRAVSLARPCLALMKHSLASRPGQESYSRAGSEQAPEAQRSRTPDAAATSMAAWTEGSRRWAAPSNPHGLRHLVSLRLGCSGHRDELQGQPARRHRVFPRHQHLCSCYPSLSVHGPRPCLCLLALEDRTAWLLQGPTAVV